jgi:polyphosphate kinase 2
MIYWCRQLPTDGVVRVSRKKERDRREGEHGRDRFDIDAAELPDWVADHAFSSGGYPYENRLARKIYERELYRLQIELVKLQDWVVRTGERIVIVWEGRDAAGKGGTIKRFIENLNPRRVRIVALPTPTERERGEWYFQRYVANLPTRGEVALYDRSWYNRAGVEPVMGFCSVEETAEFLDEAPKFEAMLVRCGIRLFKIWLTVGREEQLRRLHARRHDRLKRWKLSPIDLAAIDRWDDYTRARQTMFQATDSSIAPWAVVKLNDKRRGRLNCFRHVLNALDYDDKDVAGIGETDPLIVGSTFQDID